MSRCLIIFAKAPRLGTVKTRLQAAHSAEHVRRLYVAFLRDTVEMAGNVRGKLRRVIAFTPSNGEVLLRQTLGSRTKGFVFAAQRGADLGERMHNAFLASFQHGATRTVIIGTDSPSLPARLVDEAFAALARNDLVLGPSTDGGYYLIGARIQPRKRSGAGQSGARMGFLSNGIEWSTERALEQTVANARHARLRVALLAPWYDVDDDVSLRFLRSHLGALAACGSKDFPTNTWKALRSETLL